MAMFNSYVKLPEGTYCLICCLYLTPLEIPTIMFRQIPTNHNGAWLNPIRSCFKHGNWKSSINRGFDGKIIYMVDLQLQCLITGWYVTVELHQLISLVPFHQITLLEMVPKSPSLLLKCHEQPPCLLLTSH